MASFYCYCFAFLLLCGNPSLLTHGTVIFVCYVFLATRLFSAWASNEGRKRTGRTRRRSRRAKAECGATNHRMRRLVLWRVSAASKRRGLYVAPSPRRPSSRSQRAARRRRSRLQGAAQHSQTRRCSHACGHLAWVGAAEGGTGGRGRPVVRRRRAWWLAAHPKRAR